MAAFGLMRSPTQEFAREYAAAMTQLEDSLAARDLAGCDRALTQVRHMPHLALESKERAMELIAGVGMGGFTEPKRQGLEREYRTLQQASSGICGFDGCTLM